METLLELVLKVTQGHRSIQVLKMLTIIFSTLKSQLHQELIMKLHKGLIKDPLTRITRQWTYDKTYLVWEQRLLSHFSKQWLVNH
jgi:hypothetical protein